MSFTASGSPKHKNKANMFFCTRTYSMSDLHPIQKEVIKRQPKTKIKIIRKPNNITSWKIRKYLRKQEKSIKG